MRMRTVSIGAKPVHVCHLQVPIVDLRPRGAPDLKYACNVRRLVINGHGYALDVPLPAAVDVSGAKAKFSKKSSELTLTVPVAEAA